MKIQSPEGTTKNPRTITFTHVFAGLGPSTQELVSAGFVFVLSTLALAGLKPSFQGWFFLVAGVAGVLLGIGIGLLFRKLSWHWLIGAAALTLAYFLVGPAIAVPDEAMGKVLPTWNSTKMLGRLATDGWMDFLTTLPPMDERGQFIALPFLLGLVAGWLAFLVARATTSPLPPVAVLTLVFALVVVIGTWDPWAAWLQGILFGVLAFCWLAFRYLSRRTLRGQGRSRGATSIAGTVLVAAALGVALLAGMLFSVNPLGRVVARNYVKPPVVLSNNASPLEGFRKYSSPTLKRFNDQTLMDVEGADGQLLRIAVMDDYSGRNWSADRGSGSGSGFQRLGSSIPHVPADGKKDIRITIRGAYAAATEGSMDVWVPSLGETSSVRFEGGNTKSHQEHFHFNITTMQGLVTDRFRDGDVVKVTSAPFVEARDQEIEPAGDSALDGERLSFLSGAERKWSGAARSPWDRLRANAAALKGGFWSDGTRGGEAQYLPGHGQRRLADFVNVAPIVGSDEQYASTMALLAARVGYPSRVVMGAKVPSGGQVKGADVTAWVEVQGTQGWVVLPPSMYIPDRNKHPEQQPKPISVDEQATNVPPPNPARAPGSFDQVADSPITVAKVKGSQDQHEDAFDWMHWLRLLSPVLALLALLLLILAAKAGRSRYRYAHGAPLDRVTAGWRDVTDLARDMRLPVVAGATRLEHSRAWQVEPAHRLARSTDAAVFGEGEPSAAEAKEHWRSVSSTKKAMLKSLPWWKGLLVRLSPRSFVPMRSGRTSRPAPAGEPVATSRKSA